MIRSMTGYGRCLVENAVCSQQWEVKSVNGKYLDIKWRLPPLVRQLEPALEKVARAAADRGRVEISLQLSFAKNMAPKLAFYEQQAAAMLEAVARLASERGDHFSPDYSQFLHMPALWGEPELDEDQDIASLLENGLQIALDDWNDSRTMEGEALAKDLNCRFMRMEEWTDLIRDRAPEIREDRLKLLRERLRSVLEMSGSELEESRFLQEVVILSDKMDVSEELTRLDAHLNRLGTLLEMGGDVGRRLDFTLQECFREINTCGAKLSDANISPIIVDFKTELEKCREQVQNLE